ncbi:MAG: hypothetical protein ABIT71_04995 [Vicinamibacteraceae bacterium]
MSRHTRFLCTLLLVITAGCNATPSPTGPTASAVAVLDVSATRRIGTSQSRVYEVWATVTTGGLAATVVTTSVTLSGGSAPPLTHSEPGTGSIKPGESRGLYVIVPDGPTDPVRSVVEVAVTLDDGAGHRSQAAGSGVVRDFGPPELTASVERATLAAGDVTRIHWRATNTAGVVIDPIVGALFPSEGSTEITPCPGTTMFDVRTGNVSGDAHILIPVTVGGAPRLPWYCGTWSGPATETWTDSAGAPGSWNGAVTLAAFQSAGRVTGHVVRNLPLHGNLVRPLTASVSAAGGLTATVPAEAAGYPRESGPRFACPIELDARLSPDGATLSGTFTAQCTPEANRIVTLQGRFDATRHENPYPAPYSPP